jgi:hypothetical protein
MRNGNSYFWTDDRRLLKLDHRIFTSCYLFAMNKPVFREWLCAGILSRYTLYSTHQAILRSEVVFQSRLRSLIGPLHTRLRFKTHAVRVCLLWSQAAVPFRSMYNTSCSCYTTNNFTIAVKYSVTSPTRAPPIQVYLRLILIWVLLPPTVYTRIKRCPGVIL